MLLIKLGKTDCHFSAARTWSGDDDQRSGGLDIVVFSISFFADDQWKISRITFNRIMKIRRDACFGQFPTEAVGSLLTGIPGDHNTADQKP